MALLSPQMKTSVYSCWLLCVIWKYSEYIISHSTLQYKVYQDLGKGKVIADSVITTTSTFIAFMFTTYYCLFSNVNDRLFVE